MTSLTPTSLAEMEPDVRKRVAAHVKEHGIAVPVADDIKLINEFFWVRPDSDGRAWDTGRVWVIGQILATYRAIFNSDRAALLQDRKVLEGEIERLNGEVLLHYSTGIKLISALRATEATIAAQAARIALLEERLKPFAEYAVKIPANIADGCSVEVNVWRPRISCCYVLVGDLRRAAEALRP